MNIQQVQRENMARMQSMLALTGGVPTDQVYAWDMVSKKAKIIICQVAGLSTHYAGEMWHHIAPVDRTAIQKAVKRVGKVCDKLLVGGEGVASV